MFLDKIKKLLEHSRFTTCEIQKNFLPRRIGLGYNFKYENVEIDLVKELKKKQRKNSKRMKIVSDGSESDEEIISKSKMVK
ncbi:hypothetical protein AAJ76_4200021129 [Vairimorpha ceranae]|uniref:Uncharacterized protein n=1 Tax=Vairimorpha ceranae TaxID=40302 RepID=A0A0F9YQJ7_9MICR|nr:hypothetical protein AAJ76_4200021129 [Vairimorpha ceranae]KAF5139939.1 hypothetical protein G9O61_00g018590 [Vairimorpha ceranae]KKO74852.1 hypothetical protein AAJ76_4200021129 [Vairimorpha ceranae]